MVTGLAERERCLVGRGAPVEDDGGSGGLPVASDAGSSGSPVGCMLMAANRTDNRLTGTVVNRNRCEPFL